MKKAFKFVALAALLVIGACSARNEIVFYTNSEPITDGDVAIEVDYEENYYNYALAIRFSFLSNNPKPITVKFDGWKIFRERDNAEYAVSCTQLMPYNKLILECDIKNTLEFRVPNLPSLLKEDNYKFVTNYNSKALICHLYDKPAER